MELKWETWKEKKLQGYVEKEKEKFMTRNRSKDTFNTRSCRKEIMEISKKGKGK